MGFAEGQQWWERWQLHALVLSSLFLQFFLLLAGVLRKHRTPPWFRFLTWVAYLGSDALAIYALAILFSRRKRPQGVSPSLPRGGSGLEVLLAPVLLLHLGGRDGITAYSIQDNELWRRRFLIAASQVAVAIYVFRKTWPGGDKRLLLAAILLFVPGIVKCLDKPWALKTSAFSTMPATVDGQQVPDQQGYSRDKQNSSNEEGCSQPISIEEGHSQDDCKSSNSLEKFVKDASLVYADPDSASSSEEKVQHDPYNLFVDLPWPYSDRLDNLRSLCHKRADEVHAMVRSSLSRTFDRLYSNNCKGYLGALVRAMLMVMTFVAIGLFTAASRGGGYDNADVKAMHILLWSTAALELISFSAVATTCLGLMPQPWPDQVAQCNLIGYLVHREKHRRRWRFAALLGFDVYADWLWCTAPSRALRSSGRGITEVIHTHITDQWKKYIHDIAAYQEFNDSRGQWTLDKEPWKSLPMEAPTKDSSTHSLAIPTKKSHTEDPSSHNLILPTEPPTEDPPIHSLLLASSVCKPFDQSVIVWHVATDLCFFHKIGNGSEENRRWSREISNYLVYLLLVKPEMLVPGAKRRVFMVAYEQVKQTLVKDNSLEDDDDLAKKRLPRGATDDMTRMIMKKADLKDPTGPGLVRDACVLARELMDLAARTGDEGEEKMWRMIRGVWVEMLCFSASKCRGYLHAKSLGTGGEYLSYVWLLCAYMGLETLGDRIQRSEE